MKNNQIFLLGKGGGDVIHGYVRLGCRLLSVHTAVLGYEKANIMSNRPKFNQSHVNPTQCTQIMTKHTTFGAQIQKTIF